MHHKPTPGSVDFCPCVILAHSRGVTLELTHVSEHGLPQRTKIMSHPFFTNCNVSRVFGSKSGCGVVACGMV